MKEHKNFIDDLKIVIIKSSGAIDAIFSSDDNSSKNTISLDSTDDINTIIAQYNTIKDSVYSGDDMKDRHLFYIKQYLNHNFIDELENINIGKIYDDLLIYYYLSNLGNIILINSNEHSNFIIIPSNGISDEQKERLTDISSIFPDTYKVELTDNLYLDTFESDGNTYATLEVGDSKSGVLKEVIGSYSSKTK